MQQLTGLACAVCGERIATALDGRFCGKCGAPVHVACARAMARAGACPACGTKTEVAHGYRRALAREEAAKVRDLRAHHRAQALFSLGVGAGLIALGVPATFLGWEKGFFWIVYAPLAAGVAMLGRAVVHLRALARLRRETVPRDA